MTVFTLGHSTRSEDELAAALVGHGVVQVADVRRFPGSRRHPQFAREELMRWLAGRGFEYVWIGETLGGFRAPPSGARGGERGTLAHYDAYMTSPAFARGIATLERLATDQTTAILCAEADWSRCHRGRIADALVRRGVEVMHIVDSDKAEAHSLAPCQGALDLTLR